VRFEWDRKKNEANQQKHGISFDEVKELVTSDDCLEIYDEEHSVDEDRFLRSARSALASLLWYSRSARMTLSES
jgi:uncharacterized DUF497 family protein